MNAAKPSDLELQLMGYRLTLAKITYRLPDHPAVLQEYIWQDLDIAPKFPVLTGFLAYWKKNLDGPLFSVIVASRQLLRPAEFRVYGNELQLH